MARSETIDRYSPVAVVLHWAIAVFILFNLALGYFMEGFGPPWRLITLFLHVSAGISVLILTVLRVIWRVTHRPPPFLPGLTRVERVAAHAVHALLYVSMVAMPMIGWAIVSAHPPAGATWNKEPQRPMGRIWGVVPLPRLAAVEAIGATPEGGVRQKALHEQLVGFHGLGGYIMIALLLLHVAGALKHQYLDHQRQFARMGLGRRMRRSAAMR